MVRRLKLEELLIAGSSKSQSLWSYGVPSNGVGITVRVDLGPRGFELYGWLSTKPATIPVSFHSPKTPGFVSHMSLNWFWHDVLLFQNI